MVDTVLSRDKNWARWKAESCPPIAKSSVEATTYVSAQNSLLDMCAKKPIIAPPGANDFDFLKKNEPLESLKYPGDHTPLPTLEGYYKSIQAADLDLDFAATDTERREIEEKKAGSLWRALRLATHDGSRFNLCERIQDGANPSALLGEEEEEEQRVENVETEQAPEEREDQEVREEQKTMDEGAEQSNVEADAITTDGAGETAEQASPAPDEVEDEDMEDFAPPGQDDS